MGLGLAGANCFEGGGHSVHPKSLWEQGMVQVVPDPWVPADILADVGPQVVYSEVPDPVSPVPSEGNTMGNMHATLWCEEWTVDGEPRSDLLFGWVGMKVERPEWSDEAPTHHYVVTVVATNDDTIHERLVAGGIHAMRITAQRTETPGGVLRIQMQTDHNGEYDSLFKPKAFGDMKATHIRLWFQRENADGTYTPTPLDLLSTGGEHLVNEGQGYFSHRGTDHHGPQGGAAGQTAALLYRGFDRVFQWGPAANVTVPSYYDH